MKKHLLFIPICLSIILSITTTNLIAQTKEDEIESYKTDLAFGLNINSMSGLLGGFNVKHAKQIKPLHYRTLFFELVNVKHPKEDTRIAIANGESFTPGKLNYLAFLRSHYGREIVLFRPAKEQGVQINFVGSAGATVGFEIPYFIEYNPANSAIVIERYDPTKHAFGGIVRSRGILGEGLSQMSMVYGASAKIALSFRFNAFRNTSVGLEGGTMIDYMNRKTQIMVGGEDKQLYHTFFLTLFYAIQTR